MSSWKIAPRCIFGFGSGTFLELFSKLSRNVFTQLCTTHYLPNTSLKELHIGHIVLLSISEGMFKTWHWLSTIRVWNHAIWSPPPPSRPLIGREIKGSLSVRMSRSIMIMVARCRGRSATINAITLQTGYKTRFCPRGKLAYIRFVLIWDLYISIIDLINV